MTEPRIGGLEAAYRSQGPGLWRALLAYSGDREIASDAVAESFAQALRGGDSIRQPERWVWTVAFRVAAGALKDRGREGDLAREDTYEMPEDAALMAGLLRLLPPKQRAAVILHYYVDMPNTQISRVLGVTVPTVRVHLSQGRRRLRQLLEETDG